MSTFNQIINEDQAVLIDFFATWCGPCKMMPPILDQVKKNLGSQLRILKIDVDKNPSVAAKYQVRGVPTFVLYKEGKQVWRQSGMINKSDLEKLIHSFS